LQQGHVGLEAFFHLKRLPCVGYCPASSLLTKQQSVVSSCCFLGFVRFIMPCKSSMEQKKEESLNGKQGGNKAVGLVF